MSEPPGRTLPRERARRSSDGLAKNHGRRASRGLMANIDQVLDTSEEVTLLGSRLSTPRLAIACLAISLNRLCQTYGISINHALLLSRTLNAGPGLKKVSNVRLKAVKDGTG